MKILVILLQLLNHLLIKYYSGHKDFYPTSTAPIAQMPFIFRPGHRLRISNFVSEVKRRHERKFEVTKASSKRKLANFSKPLFKKIKASVKAEDSDTDSECIDTIASVSKQIGASIAKWVRSQSCIVLKHLNENRDFTVVVTNTPKSVQSLLAAMHVMPAYSCKKETKFNLYRTGPDM